MIAPLVDLSHTQTTTQKLFLVMRRSYSVVKYRVKLEWVSIDLAMDKVEANLSQLSSFSRSRFSNNDHNLVVSNDVQKLQPVKHIKASKISKFNSYSQLYNH